MVYLQTKRCIGSFQRQGGLLNSSHAVKQFAIMPDDRQQLHANIAKRFYTMLDNGLIDEARNILSKYDISEDSPVYKMVGYHEVFEYLRGTTSQDQMQKKAIYATRQLAKRQLTWIRNWSNKNLMKYTNSAQLCSAIARIL